MAALGEIPGAARFGKNWTFDKAKFERWIIEREKLCHEQGLHRKAMKETSSNEAKSGGSKRQSPMSRTKKVLEHAISEMLGKDVTSDSKNSKMRRSSTSTNVHGTMR